TNGLLNDQFNYNSGYKDTTGKLYFGSVRGMITFNPDAFFQPRFIPPVYITGFQVHNKELVINKDNGILKKSVVYTNEITLPYDQSSFSIDFAAISFTAPEMTEFKYITEGLDREWTFLKSIRKVYFTNLEPGRYVFRVMAGHDGIWSNSPRELVIQVTPPWWATAWAYSIYCLAGLTLIYFLSRIYHNMQENKKEKEIYEAKIEFFTNIAHEIKTPLTLIKGPVENLSDMVVLLPGINDDVMTMERNTNRLINLTNQILDFRQTETKGFSLNFAVVNINEILQEAYLTFEPVAKKRQLSYSLIMPPSDVTMMADGEALNKVFANLFSNAVKYAQKEITIQLFPQETLTGSLVIELANDGFIIPKEMREQIFEPFFRLKETIKEKGTGIGLALARSLVQLHNGDLYLKEGSIRKNIFVLRIPCYQEQKKKRSSRWARSVKSPIH
ncbi:MAG: hybrid sensor histidine kinase/response regulator, partial [Chitinophagaceae bacterium]|nr:hybrid sensor histidine kinase/response regulator [Chitinophagaceae bacterium]